MTQHPMKWETTKDHEHLLYWGPFAVASVVHWAVKREEKDKPYIARTMLPGVDIRKELRFAAVEDAMDMAEKATLHWFDIMQRAALPEITPGPITEEIMKWARDSTTNSREGSLKNSES